jgi:hypothetical protein
MNPWYIFQDAYLVCGGTVERMSPSFLEASTAFVRNLINEFQWLYWINLSNSENLSLGQCMLSVLHGNQYNFSI